MKSILLKALKALAAVRDDGRGHRDHSQINEFLIFVSFSLPLIEYAK
jgi:hypothetical protein